MVRELNPEATVVAAPWDHLAGEDLVKAIESRDTLKASMEALKAEHHHHHDEDECDDPECECHHHHHHDEDDEEEHEHHHHHHDDDDDDEHEHHHHHHDEDECDDPECECHHHHHDDEEDEHEHHHHHHHHGHDADEIFESWGIETMHRFTEDELKEKLGKLDDEATYGVVLRAKGVVPAADGEQWIHFDHVPGEVEIRRGSAGVIGRLCVIGSKMHEDALKALFTE
jgi:hypothetical protein